jgi:hypothetical protein
MIFGFHVTRGIRARRSSRFSESASTAPNTAPPTTPCNTWITQTKTMPSEKIMLSGMSPPNIISKSNIPPSETKPYSTGPA